MIIFAAMNKRSIIESRLGFERLREAVISKTTTDYAAFKASEEEISTDAAQVEYRQAVCDEMRVIRMFEASFPEPSYIDCIPFLVPLKGGQDFIDLESLVKLRSSLDLLRRILAFFSTPSSEKYPLLKQMSSSVISFPEVLRRIDTILDRFSQIRDSASEELFAIRKAIREQEGAASRKIQSILRSAAEEGLVDEEATVSVRDGKLLIPISSANKRKIRGIVYDESASGKTSFIEPIEVIEINNRLRQLHLDEQREIIRILTLFTDFLRPYIDDILSSEEFMGELDFIDAKCAVGMRYRGGKPVLNLQGEVLLRQARHPLLEEALKREGKEIVPLDITLNSQKRILLVSGPNAGGKSVALKTTGLLQYMYQWGLPVPASQASEMMVFNRFFVDIGDGQSLDNDLSTYSSHLLNMKEVLDGADENSLVLIDEFGSGTEPSAGGAIAEEILSVLDNRGCYGVITTHYSNLKFYATGSNRVINGAMLFDIKKISPEFKLEIGLPGNSFAFELARKMGLDEAVVKGAEERVGKDYVSIERNLKKIAKNRKQLEERLVRIKATDRTLDSITEKYEKELSEIKALRKQIIDEAKAQAKDIVDGANRQIENTIRQIKEAQAQKERTAAARKELKDFKDEIDQRAVSQNDELISRKMAQIIERKKRQEERRQKRAAAAELQGQTAAVDTPEQQKPAPEKVEITIGTFVKVNGTDIVGKVIELSKGNLQVAVGDIVYKTKLNQVTPISNASAKDFYKAASRPSTTSSSLKPMSAQRLEFKPSIDVRGMRLEEAIPAVSRFIDDAMIVGVNQVSILHGKGNGVLKEEIRKYLKITPGIISFADEHIERGGSGITIVNL